MPKRKKRTPSLDYPRDPAQVYQWLEHCWQITGKTGVRVFHDYLRKHQQRDCCETPSNWKRVIAARAVY